MQTRRVNSVIWHGHVKVSRWTLGVRSVEGRKPEGLPMPTTVRPVETQSRLKVGLLAPGFSVPDRERLLHFDRFLGLCGIRDLASNEILEAETREDAEN